MDLVPSLLSAYLMKARILDELKRYDEVLQAAEQAVAHIGKTQNQAGAKAAIEKVIAELKKLKG